MADRAYEQLKSALKASATVRSAAAGSPGHTPSIGGWTGGARFDGLGRRQVPRQEFDQARSRPTIGHAIDDVGEVGLRIEAIHASRLNDRINVCGAQAPFVATQEEEIFPCDCNSPQSSFGDIVVYRESAPEGCAKAPDNKKRAARGGKSHRPSVNNPAPNFGLRFAIFPEGRKTTT